MLFGVLLDYSICYLGRFLWHAGTVACAVFVLFMSFFLALVERC